MKRLRWILVVFASILVLSGIGSAQEPAAPPSDPARNSGARLTEPEPVAEPVAEGGEAAEGAPEPTYAVPERVTVGVHLNDIQSIDLKSHSYAMDFYIWFRWKNPALDPAASMEIGNPIELWGLMVTPLYEEPETLDDGTLYQVLRIQGTFSKKLPLYGYPFDRQLLTVLFEDGVSDTSTMTYVADTTPATMNSALQLPGYRLDPVTFAISDWTYPTAFGDPRSGPNTVYSRASLAVPISRPPLAYATKLFLPVLCVIVCAALMFLLSPGLVDSRVDVGITSLLTIVALQMTYNSDLPDVGYLMLMDKVYLLAYLFVIVGLAVVVRTTRMAEQGQAAEAMVLHGRVLAGLVFVWGSAMVWLITSAIQQG